MTLVSVKNGVRTAGVAAFLVAWFTELHWMGWVSTACYGSLGFMVMVNDIRSWLGLPRARWFDKQGVTIFDVLADRARRALANRWRHRLVKAPGRRLDAIACFLWSQKTYERVFKPARVDLINEWRTSVETRQLAKARWIYFVRAPYTILSHMFFQLPWSVAKTIKSLLK